MSEKFPDPEENERPDPEEEVWVATIDEFVGAIRALLENHQESEVQALYRNWVAAQERKRDALNAEGDRRVVAEFMVERELDRAQIYAARKNIPYAYMTCVEAEYMAQQSNLGKLVLKCQERQDAYYDENLDIDTRIECDRMRACFLAKNIENGIKNAFDILDAAVVKIREENRPDLIEGIKNTAARILRHEWRRLCWYVESERGDETVQEFMGLAILARYIGRNDLAHSFMKDARRVSRGETTLQANLDWAPEKDTEG